MISRGDSPISHPIRILFLCTGNSARSIMAEAIASELFGETLAASSAGSTPRDEPNPLALRTLAKHGLPTDRWRSKSWIEFADRSFDLVVTLCDAAAKETCPVFPGTPIQAHWGFPDPPAADDPEAMFERVFEGLVEALSAFASDETVQIDVRAAKVAELVKTRFPSAGD